MQKSELQFKSQNIPSGWENVRLNDVIDEVISGDWGTGENGEDFVKCRVLRGMDFTIAQNGFFENVPIRFIKKRNLEKLKLNSGDILVELSGGSKDQPTGRILIWRNYLNIQGENIVFSNFVKKLKLNQLKINPEYFYRYWQLLYLLGKTTKYEKRTTGIRNFKYRDFIENEYLHLPPLPEQQKIVYVLDSIQEAVRVQEKIIEKTKELKKSLMAKLFREGAPSFSKGRKLKKTEIGEIPEDWEVVRLGDQYKKVPLVLLLRNGLVYKQFELKDTGIPVARIETIAEGKIDFSKVGYLENLSEDIIKEYKIRKGDILFSHINSEPHLGKTGIYLKEERMLIHGMNLLLIRVNENLLNAIFLNYLFNYFKDKNIFISIASRAVNQSSINQNTLKNLKISLPPLPEQREIVEILQTIDQKIEIEQKKKTLYEELFKIMLNKLMTGEIRVNNI